MAELTPKRVKELREDHVEGFNPVFQQHSEFCSSCGEEWPCPVSALLDMLEAAEAKLARYAEAIRYNQDMADLEAAPDPAAPATPPSLSD